MLVSLISCIQKMIAQQPEGRPFHIVGYSFGAMVAYEIACLLQKQGHQVKTLTLLDGAPKYVAVHTTIHKNKFDKSGDINEEEASALCAFLMQYIDIDFLKVRTFFTVRTYTLDTTLISVTVKTHILHSYS